MGFILLVGFLSFKSNEGSGDCDLGAFDAMDVQQGIVNYLQNNNCYDKNIGGAWFLTKLALTNPDCGYIKGGASFQKVNWDINKETDFVIFENINPDKRHDGIKTDSSFTMAYKYTKGSIWGEIYRRK